jgi:uncharacterized protein (TIGR03437 family)
MALYVYSNIVVPGCSLFSMALFALTTACISADPMVSVLNQSTSPGGSVLVPVVFASQQYAISGIQFDLQYDSAAVNLGATLGDQSRNSAKSVYVADIDSNTRRFLLIGFNQNAISDGVVINLFVNVNQNTADGVYTLALSNVLATDPSGNASAITSTSGAVTVQGTVGQSVPLKPQGVLNAGSLVSGPVAPGEVITLIGAGIGPSSVQSQLGSPTSTVLGGTTLLFDGTPAPLFFVSTNQINAIVPYEVFGNATTQLQIASQGQIVAGLNLSTTSAAPAIFTVDATGAGQGAILNQDSSVNSPLNPASKGSVISIFATGAGQTDPPGIDGQVASALLPTPLLPVSVRIDGIDAETTYAGAAPEIVAGVLQVTCVVPTNAGSGPSVPIVLTVGSSSSQTGVTVAIK